MNLRGLSITIPHKENALRYVQENGGTIDDLSLRIGAINTIVFPIENQKSKIKNTLHGLNTDYAGALDALVTAWTGKRADVANKRIAVLGAGGAARAIVAGLTAHGALVTIYNRTFEKAQALAAEFPGASAAPLEQLAPCDALVNCTPLGMHPKTSASPLDSVPFPDWLKDTVVFDTVYNPRMTKLLKLAEKRGAKIVTGDEMFVRQAALQFQEFTSRPAPLEVFRNVLAAALKT